MKTIGIDLFGELKVDIVNYHYKWLKASIKIDGLLLADKEDIAAMKLSAIDANVSGWLSTNNVFLLLIISDSPMTIQEFQNIFSHS